MRFKIPKEYHINQKKMTAEKIAEGKCLLKAGNSERFVAKAIGVSRHVMKMYCKPGFREWYEERYGSWEYVKEHAHTLKDIVNRSNKRRYKIANELFPEQMKLERKRSKEAIGKEYFKNYMKDWREKHPGYFKKYTSKKKYHFIKFEGKGKRFKSLPAI